MFKLFASKKDARATKVLKWEDVSCVHVHDTYGGWGGGGMAQVGETILNNYHFVGKIWSFPCLFEKWPDATARITSATTKI